MRGGYYFIFTTFLRQLSQANAQYREQYKQVSGGVTERSRVLAQITDDIETIKSEMEEKGSSMTDGSPLVNIRKNLARVKQELLGMDVRIGVLEHTVMQARLRDRWDVLINILINNCSRQVHHAARLS